MGFPRRDRRGGSKTVGLFKMLPPKNSTETVPVYLLMHVPMRYHAIPDKLFPGKWLAQPVDYMGRGIVYIYNTPEEAKEKASQVNRRQGFK